VQPEEILDRLWPGRPRAVEPLSGGITNHNFTVSFDDETVVLRIVGRDTSLLGIDRESEEAASRTAASIGVGPEVVAFGDGYLITRFIPGEPIPPDRMRAPDSIARVARALRDVHGAPAIPGRFDAHRVVEAYRDTASAHGVAIPPAYEWAHGVSARIETARGSQQPVPCHNDLLNANFLDDGARIRIVDWEYAGMGDRFFDLANFSINHEFARDDDRALLAAYFERDSTDADAAALGLMRFMSDFREAMWGVVQQGISELDVDFVDYADQHFERLRRTAGAPEFRDWLAAALPAS
jgi:thiamine kinase-like enzyme